MYHTLDPDAPEWRCIECGHEWSGALAFMTDDRDCAPAWRNRALADVVSPIIWHGVASEYDRAA